VKGVSTAEGDFRYSALIENVPTYKVAVSIILGLLGFAVNFYTLNFAFPPYTATVLIGLLFPMLITLAWGWKYGLLSALVGGCQSMWWLWGPSNGYATFFVVPPFTLWIVWHGLCADWRREQKDHVWWLNAYVVEIPFRILGTINLYTLSRWAITLNPPPWSWAADAPNTIPMRFSSFVVIKQAAVGYVILLLADVLLNLGFVRRFFRLKEDHDQVNTGYIISASLLLGVLFWLVDSIIGSLVFHTESSFLDLLALDIPPDKVYVRTFFILACLLGGLLTSKLLRRQRESDRALQEIEERMRQVVENMPVMMDAFDTEGHFIVWNRECERVTGYSADEIVGNPKATELLYPDPAYRERMLAAWAERGDDYRDWEWQMPCKDGSVKTVAWSNISARFPIHGWATWSIGVDVTERVRAEERAAHLSLVLRAVRNVNQLITREKDRDRLLQSACDNLIKTRGYHNAWTALLDEGGELVTTAEARSSEDFSALVEQLRRGELTACARKAMAQPGVVVIADPASACAGCPLSASYDDRGAMTVRLEYGGKVYGLLSVSVPADFIADEEERSLFNEVAGDIAFALRNIELEKERVRAQEALRKSEERYRTVVEYQTDLICRFLPDGTLTFVNQAYCRHHGQQREDLVGHSFTSQVLPEDRERVVQHLASFSREKPVATIEHRAVTAGGKVRWQQWINRPMFDAQGNVTEFQAVGRDVTERKRAEEALRESEERYRSVVENSPTGIFIVNDAYQFTYVNDELCRILGYSREEIIGQDFQRFLDDESRQLVADRYVRRQKGEEVPPRYEFNIIRKDGEKRRVEISSAVIEDSAGNMRTVAQILDITERKRAEESLRESEERFRDLFENSPDAIFVQDFDGNVLDVNPAACRLHGVERGDLIGRNASELVPPDRRGEAISDSIKLAQGELDYIESLSWTEDGRAVPVEIRGSRMDYSGKPVALLHVRDITERVRSEEERVRAEEALAEEKERLGTILSTMNIGLILHNPDRTVAWVNRWIRQMFPHGDPVGQVCYEFFEGKSSPCDSCAVRDCFETGEIRTVESHNQANDRWYSSITHPIKDEASHVIQVLESVMDITERVRSEEKREQMEQQLHRQERLAAVGQLAGGIAHDFNNMLTVIMLYAHQLLRQEQPDARTVSAAETIIKESKRATKLVGQILDFSRRSPLEISPLDLGPFIKEAVHILERTLPESIQLHLDVGAEEYVVKGDPTRIQQVLMNLVVNARDAMPEGGDLRIELAGIELRPGDASPVIEMAPGEWIRLSVSDTGTGIPPHVLDHIFEPFFTTKEPGKGTGLGLAQVYGIVAQHGGHIGVETQVGQGTTFRVYLPIIREKEQVAKEESTTIPQGQGETILMVEDNESLRQGGRDLLELLGYRVLTAANGREALEICRVVKETRPESGRRIDLVITDLVMPKMGGKQLMQELGKINPDLKVLALTGYAMEQSQEELKEAGFLDVIYKPFDVDKLARVIHRALSRGEP